MDAREYNQTQIKLVGIGNILQGLDLDGFIDAALKAESVGAVIDPTLYRRGIDSLTAIREFAQTARKLKTAFREVQRVVLDRIEREGFPLPGEDDET